MRKAQFLKKIVKELLEKDKNVRVILIRDSTAYGKIKNHSDIYIEILTTRPKKLPCYRILSFNGKKVLLTAYYEKFRLGKEIRRKRISKNVRVLYGYYNKNLKRDFKKEEYSKKEQAIRNKQLYLDFLFKYKRTGDKQFLHVIEKYKRKLKSMPRDIF